MHFHTKVHVSIGVITGSRIASQEKNAFFILIAFWKWSYMGIIIYCTLPFEIWAYLFF